MWSTIAQGVAARQLRHTSVRGTSQKPEWGCPLEFNGSTSASEIMEFWDGSDQVGNDTAVLEDDEVEHRSFLQNSGRYATDALLFGMFDSGTNLLEKFTKKNIPGFRISNVRFGNIWKHLFPAQILRRVSVQNRKRTLAMVVVRNPLSQIAGWKKAPYDLGRCLKAGQWLGDRCPCGQGLGSHYDCSKNGLAYRGFPDVWNSYVRGYMQLEKAGFMKVVTVRYEDLVMAPETVLKNIATHYGAPLKGPIKTIDAPAKNHGRCVGREMAIKKIRMRQYRNKFSPGELSSVCGRLDKSLLSTLNYNDECPGSGGFARPQTPKHNIWKPDSPKSTTTTTTGVTVEIKIKGANSPLEVRPVVQQGGGSAMPTSRAVHLGAQANLCLNVFLRGDKVQDGDTLGFWDCTGAWNERLSIRSDHTIRVETQPEFCLGINLKDNMIQDGNELGMFPCSGSWNQRFVTFPDGTMRPLGHTNFCFSVILTGVSAKSGDHAGLYNCQGSSGAWNQRFFVQ